MKLTLHLSFAGECEAAFRFYQGCLGGEITTLLTWGESPLAEMVPFAWRGKICHASLEFEGCVLAGVDPPPSEYGQPSGFQVLLELEDIARAEKVFAALAEGGTIKVAMQRVFWAERFGVLIDRFGVQWEVQGQTAPTASSGG